MSGYLFGFHTCLCYMLQLIIYSRHPFDLFLRDNAHIRPRDRLRPRRLSRSCIVIVHSIVARLILNPHFFVWLWQIRYQRIRVRARRHQRCFLIIKKKLNEKLHLYILTIRDKLKKVCFFFLTWYASRCSRRTA